MSRAGTSEREILQRELRRKRLESIGHAAKPIEPSRTPFLALTAFRSESLVEIAELISDYITSHGVTSEPVDLDSTFDYLRDAQIYAPVNGWTVVFWPAYFNNHDFPLARAIAAVTGWLISTLHVYNHEYWEHLCCWGESELHAFCSRPQYWRDDARDIFVRIRAYATEPSRLASALGISRESIWPYLVDADALADPGGKAHPDDQFALGNFRVLTDFWRRLGIHYPEPPQNLAAVLRLGANAGSWLPSV